MVVVDGIGLDVGIAKGQQSAVRYMAPQKEYNIEDQLFVVVWGNAVPHMFGSAMQIVPLKVR